MFHVSKWPEMTKFWLEKAIIRLKSVRHDPWSPMHIRLLGDSTHISSFINIGRKMTKLSSEEAVFWQKSVRRDPWSPMHIGLLMDSTLGWYLPTFQVSLKSVIKWRCYRRRKHFFRLKAVRRDPWSPMHIGILMDSRWGWYLPTFQVSSKLT